MKTYRVHVFKNGSTKGIHFDMKASTIQNLRKNLIAKYRNSKGITEIFIDTSKGSYVGNMKINPKTKDVHWYEMKDLEGSSLVTKSTGALRKDNSQKRK